MRALSILCYFSQSLGAPSVFMMGGDAAMEKGSSLHALQAEAPTTPRRLSATRPTQLHAPLLNLFPA